MCQIINGVRTSILILRFRSLSSERHHVSPRNHHEHPNGNLASGGIYLCRRCQWPSVRCGRPRWIPWRWKPSPCSSTLTLLFSKFPQVVPFCGSVVASGCCGPLIFLERQWYQYCSCAASATHWAPSASLFLYNSPWQSCNKLSWCVDRSYPPVRLEYSLQSHRPRSPTPELLEIRGLGRDSSKRTWACPMSLRQSRLYCSQWDKRCPFPG